MAKGIMHHNRHRLCSVAAFGSGPDPYVHEIIQLAIIPLTPEGDVDRDLPPFWTYICPTTIEGKPTKKIRAALRLGISPENLHGAILLWFDELPKRYSKWGTEKMLIPVGHDYAYTLQLISNTIGHENYVKLFRPDYRDVRVVATHISDHNGLHSEDYRFKKTLLSWIAKVLCVSRVYTRRDALQAALTVSKVYARISLE